MTPRIHACRECRKEFKTSHYNGAFCASTCRKVWNNRRARRGTQAYDLLMLVRFEPELFDKAHLAGRLEAAVNLWHSDDASHNRKRSWLPASEVAMSPTTL